MKLKDYQENVLKDLREYLNHLSLAQNDALKVAEVNPELAKDVDFPKKAWGLSQAPHSRSYHSRVNGIGEQLPNICLKVPTGGGKTLLACHAIDYVQKSYLKKSVGPVLWIVPSVQIYRQTINALKDRNHAYRQILDISSGGRTLIKEKGESFTLSDIQENLTVLMLMLPSANRKNKETLKIFKDQGGFTDFFPLEDDFNNQRKLKQLIPNLDCFASDLETFVPQIKTSLGNVLKTGRPLVIIDEGHKAYAEQAKATIRDFNPSFILELSATPPQESNVLTCVTGKDLHIEEMIKLDINLLSKSSLDWQDTLLSSFEKRNYLENLALKYHEQTGIYIRPICLIQVERTGKDQRDKQFIHAEDAREYLINKCSVPESHVAIKSSEKDDIEGINLFSEDCQIRYIITKQALQEGWDCSFAYILTVLGNPTSKTGITQLVGRILRQPFARKTKIFELDECYIYTFRKNAKTVIQDIKKGLESEGLGDITGMVVSDEDEMGRGKTTEREIAYRPEFKRFEGKIYLPKFAVQENGGKWRDLIFETDILEKIDWKEVELDGLCDISLANDVNREHYIGLSLDNDGPELLKETKRSEILTDGAIDMVFLTRQISDIVPNPWQCFEIGERAIKLLSEKYTVETITANFVFIIQELKKILKTQRDFLSERVFREMIATKKLCFFLMSESGGFNLPSRLKIKSDKQLVRDDNSKICKSLFDYVPEENTNELEQAVAIYLDRQEELLWWYRNISKQDYHIQGWKRHKIYPDFVVASKNHTDMAKSHDGYDFDKVYVLETKGLHLKNEDTVYKQDIFELCNELGKQREWKEIFNESDSPHFEFQVIFQDEWQNKINQIFES